MSTVNTSDTNKEYILSVKLALDPSIQKALDTLAKMRGELEKNARELKKSAMAFAAQGGDATKAAESLKRYNDVLRGLEGVGASASRNVGKFGMATSNASYQVTDFIVQVQGGIEPLRAFGQQAPQLLGGFGPIGAALGVIAAIAPAVVSAFMQMKDAVVPLKDAQEGLEKAFNGVGDAATEINFDALIKNYNAMGTAARLATRDLIQLDLAMIETAKGKRDAAFAKDLLDMTAVDTGTKLLGAWGDQVEKTAKSYGIARESMKDFQRDAKVLDPTILASRYGLVFEKGNAKGQEFAKTLRDIAKSDYDVAAKMSSISKFLDQSKGGADIPVVEKIGKAAKEAIPSVKELGDEFATVRALMMEMYKGALDRIEMPIRSEIIKENAAVWTAWGYSQKQITDVLAKQDEAFKKATGAWTIYDETQKQILADKDKFADYVTSVEKFILLWEGGFIKLDELNVALETIKKFKPAIDESGAAAKNAKDAYTEMTTAVGTVLGNSISNLTDVLFESKKSFREWASDVLMELAKVLVKLAAVRAFKAAMQASGYGSMFGFAQGDTFAKPTGLPTNQVIDTPHLFKFAQGGSFGVAGEAGAEAIVPLKRTPSGDLGVQASPVEVNVYNQMGSDAKVEVAENQQPDGTRQISVTIRREVKAALSDGSLDLAMRTNYGTLRRAT